MPTCLCPWVRYLVSIVLLTWTHQGGIGRGKYCNLSADKVCTWPVAPLGEAKWRDDFPDTVIIGSSALDPLAKKKCYTNADHHYHYLSYIKVRCCGALILTWRLWKNQSGKPTTGKLVWKHHYACSWARQLNGMDKYEHLKTHKFT